MIDFQQKMQENETSWQKEPKKPNKVKRSLRLFSYMLVFVIIGFFIFSSTVLMSSQSSEGWLSENTFWGKIKHLTGAMDSGLEGQTEDRINILLLGMGGKNHDGGGLTDTIMLASLKPSTKEVAMISIPRDMSIPWPGHGWIKINNINAYAEVSDPGSGSQELAMSLEELLDIKIHYYARIDFDGFTKVIDELGGLEVNVDNTLDDYRYPIRGQEDNENYFSRFEHLHFDKGWQRMDGELALKYARSRHAEGIEGSDFARARRQQKIIEAVKEELFSSHTFLRPGLISKIIGHVNDHLDTNLSIGEMVKFWNLFKDVHGDSISNSVLDDGPGGFLVASRSTAGAYILIPRFGNYNALKDYVQNIFSNSSENTTVTAEESENYLERPATIEILNGTTVGGFAARTAEGLENYNFHITRLDNAPQVNDDDTIIFDLTYGEKLEALRVLKNELSASSTITLPSWLIEYIATNAEENSNLIKPDFIIFLGNN